MRAPGVLEGFGAGPGQDEEAATLGEAHFHNRNPGEGLKCWAGVGFSNPNVALNPSPPLTSCVTLPFNH